MFSLLLSSARALSTTTPKHPSLSPRPPEPRSTTSTARVILQGGKTHLFKKQGARRPSSTAARLERSRANRRPVAWSMSSTAAAASSAGAYSIRIQCTVCACLRLRTASCSLTATWERERGARSALLVSPPRGAAPELRRACGLPVFRDDRLPARQLGGRPALWADGGRFRRHRCRCHLGLMARAAS